MKASDDVIWWSAERLAVAYRTRELSPVEVTEAVLARLSRVEPDINAFFTVTADLARSLAADSEARFARDKPLSTMDGIPYSVKDLEPTAGIRTTYGSPATRDHVPGHDGAAAGRLRSSGGVLLGKTATPDGGYKDTSETLIFPAPRNPWDLDRTPGGSSGGAAAAVASGIGPVAHGTDGAGSIRIPAALCGLVGLKPTHGRVPVWPQPFYRDSVANNGPIARCVRDVALMLDALAGPDPRDPWSVVPNPDAGFLAGLGQHHEGPRRIALSLDFGYGATDPEVMERVEAAARLLTPLGHRLVVRDPGWPDPGRLQNDWWATEFAGALGESLQTYPERFEPQLRDLIESGQRVVGDPNFAYRRMRGALHDTQLALFTDVDFLISPTLPMTAWLPGEYPTHVGGRPLPHGALGRNYLLFPFNLTGNPAVTIPAGLSRSGLPIGLQIVGRHYDEIGLLRLAQELENLVGFERSTPGLPS